LVRFSRHLQTSWTPHEHLFPAFFFEIFAYVICLSLLGRCNECLCEFLLWTNWLIICKFQNS
jgi:hypothetical protein